MSEENSKSAILCELAEVLDKFDPAMFGGCYVLIPPEGGGNVIWKLHMAQGEANRTAVQFWANLASDVKDTLEEMDKRQRVAQGYGQFR
jgi:hypothetical protein